MLLHLLPRRFSRALPCRLRPLSTRASSSKPSLRRADAPRRADSQPLAPSDRDHWGALTTRGVTFCPSAPPVPWAECEALLADAATEKLATSTPGFLAADVDVDAFPEAAAFVRRFKQVRMGGEGGKGTGRGEGGRGEDEGRGEGEGKGKGSPTLRGGVTSKSTRSASTRGGVIPKAPTGEKKFWGNARASVRVGRTKTRVMSPNGSPSPRASKSPSPSKRRMDGGEAEEGDAPAVPNIYRHSVVKREE